MSSVIALRDKDTGKIVIGYDSAQVTERGEKDEDAIVEKVFRHNYLDVIIGITGAARVCYLLRTVDFGIKNAEGDSTIPEEITMKFMTEALKKINDLAEELSCRPSLKRSSILMVVKNRIFVITENSVITEYDNAIGIGCGHGKYALQTIQRLGLQMSAEEKVLCALRVISDCNVNVYAPFHIIDNIDHTPKIFTF